VDPKRIEERKEIEMRHSRLTAFLLLVFGLLATTAPAQAAGHKVIWKRIVGIAAPDSLVGRPPGGGDCNVGVDCVAGTPAPWTTTEGRAEVDLDRGKVEFSVKGLVVAADPSFANIGTTTLITLVKGTLVCNDTQPGVPELVDTDAVALNSLGNASFRGHVDLPASCLAEPEDIVFLIRIADPDFFLFDYYNAFGAVRIGPGEAALNGSDE
jgi:hypothetical protein